MIKLDIMYSTNCMFAELRRGGDGGGDYAGFYRTSVTLQLVQSRFMLHGKQKYDIRAGTDRAILVKVNVAFRYTTQVPKMGPAFAYPHSFKVREYMQPYDGDY